MVIIGHAEGNKQIPDIDLPVCIADNLLSERIKGCRQDSDKVSKRNHVKPKPNQQKNKFEKSSICLIKELEIIYAPRVPQM